MSGATKLDRMSQAACSSILVFALRYVKPQNRLLYESRVSK